MTCGISDTGTAPVVPPPDREGATLPLGVDTLDEIAEKEKFFRVSYEFKRYTTFAY